MKNIATLEPRPSPLSSVFALIRQAVTFLPGGTAAYDEDPVCNHQELQLLASAVRAATQTVSDITNNNAHGVALVIDVTAVPGVDTVTVFIEGKDPVSGKYYTILQSAAIVAVSTVVLRVYPSLVAAANLTANDCMPRTWRVRVVHSAGTNFTYSLGGALLV